MWPLFDQTYRGLPEVLGNDKWNWVPRAVEMRNSMVHGTRVYKLAECKGVAKYVMSALKALRERATAECGRDPWSRIVGRRNPRLQWLA